jgi:cytochrome c
MVRKALFVAFILALVLPMADSAQAGGDAAKGARVFKKCTACHTLAPNKHRVGPNLAGVIGRTAGTAPGYKYSKAMRAHGASGIVWSGETLDVYLENPRKVVKGTKMTFPGVKKPQDRADLIAYLNQISEAAQ